MNIEKLGPFHNRPEEWELYSPLVGSSMLELGNKKNGEFTYKDFFQSRGFDHTSVDLNGKDGALPLDLRQPLMLGTFDMVTNIGTSEHVSDQHGVWKNILDAMHLGSVLVSTTPAPGHWQWHGEWYPPGEWFKELAELNGLSLDMHYMVHSSPRTMWFVRATRKMNLPFTMPTVEIYRNYP